MFKALMTKTSNTEHRTSNIEWGMGNRGRERGRRRGRKLNTVKGGHRAGRDQTSNIERPTSNIEWEKWTRACAVKDFCSLSTQAKAYPAWHEGIKDQVHW